MTDTGLKFFKSDIADIAGKIGYSNMMRLAMELGHEVNGSFVQCACHDLTDVIDCKWCGNTKWVTPLVASRQLMDPDVRVMCGVTGLSGHLKAHRASRGQPDPYIHRRQQLQELDALDIKPKKTSHMPYKAIGESEFSDGARAHQVNQINGIWKDVFGTDPKPGEIALVLGEMHYLNLRADGGERVDIPADIYSKLREFQHRVEEAALNHSKVIAAVMNLDPAPEEIQRMNKLIGASGLMPKGGKEKE